MSTMTHAQVSEALQSRWPEHRVGPSLERIQALCDLLGDPQHACPVIQVAGTNGKGSTCIMIESLLRAMGLRVGRFSSPHLSDVTERISIDGEPIAEDRFDDLVAQVMPFVEMVDDQKIDGISMTFFEVMTGLAYAAFAEAPVDVMVIETGLGGGWDATNVANAQVAVICPIDLDHTHILGDTIEDIAAEKAGIIKPGTVAVLAEQTEEAAGVVVEHCAEVGAKVAVAGRDFALLERLPAVGGQMIRVQSVGGPVGELLLPVFGAHMAHNAAVAIGAVEAFLGGQALSPEVIAEGLSLVKLPARLEVVHRAPTIVLDTAHNPHGVRATLAGVREAFGFEPLIAVVAMMADKDVEGALRLIGEDAQLVVCTQMSTTTRGLTANELAERATEIIGADRVRVAPDMVSAIDTAIELADDTGLGAGIVMIGSVVAAGEARDILVKPESARE